MEVEKVMAIGIIGSVIGLAVLITAVVLLVREKNDKESKKIYSVITVIGAIVFVCSMLMHKRAERLTVLMDIFSPDTAADGLEICPILPSPSFLSRQKSVPLKLRAPKTDYFC